jgi:hypothetical protein
MPGCFDVEQRLVGGIGAGFDPTQWPDTPDPDVQAVRAWLGLIAEYKGPE